MTKYNGIHARKRAFNELSSGRESSVIKTLLNSEFVGVRDSDERGNSFLLVAITKDKKNVADFLTNEPTLINFKGENGIPPTFGFNKNIDAHFLKFLVDKGMDINARDNFGNNMLHNLYKFGTADDYLACMHLGADRHAVNNEGKTPFDLAERFGKKDIFINACERFIAEEGNFNPQPKVSQESIERDNRINDKINRINRLHKRLNNTNEPAL